MSLVDNSYENKVIKKLSLIELPDFPNWQKVLDNQKKNNIQQNNKNIIKNYQNNIPHNPPNKIISRQNNITPKEIKNNVILIIVDFIYMINNLADSRYKYIKYLDEKNDNVIITGTGMKYFRPGMSIFTLVNILHINPKLIIHANNFTKNKLLVSNIKNYPCKKALIIEDMHATNLITSMLRSNLFNYALYHCDCNQLDRIKLLNRNVRFINYPHYIDTTVFKNYNYQKTYDIILYGCPNPSVYPFRYRLFNLIRSCKKFKVNYISFPGYFVKNKKAIVAGQRLAQMINKSWIGIVTCSSHDYFLKKYLEVPASYAMIAGNIPSRYRHILEGNIIELKSSMTDSQIIQILQYALSNKKKLIEDIDHLHNIIVNNFSYENGNDSFNNIIDAIDRVS